MIGYVDKIPLSQIQKASVFVNPARQPMDQIKRILGCDRIMNAGLFDMDTFEPVSFLVSGGKTLCAKGNPYGYALNDGSVSFSYANGSVGESFIGCYHLLVRDGKNVFTGGESANADRGRSAMGLTVDSLVLRCVPDTAGSADYTLGELTADMLSLGCVTAINLDGGGSSQCDFGDGRVIRSSRIVHNFLCIWLSGTKIPETYTNEPARKTVYETTFLSKAIGSLDPRETARLLEDGDDFKTVSYFITGTNIRKVGFIHA